MMSSRTLQTFSSSCSAGTLKVHKGQIFQEPNFGGKGIVSIGHLEYSPKEMKEHVVGKGIKVHWTPSKCLPYSRAAVSVGTEVGSVISMLIDEKAESFWTQQSHNERGENLCWHG